jgi:hypothetical protein
MWVLPGFLRRKIILIRMAGYIHDINIVRKFLIVFREYHFKADNGLNQSFNRILIINTKCNRSRIICYY